MKKIQIGVMGSAADLEYTKAVEEMAERVGELIADAGCTLIFGAEKDYDSLSTAACRGAKKRGGITVGITYNKGKDVFEKNADIIICTGMERGGGREFVLSLTCDAIIALGGGSGTLTEIAIAYQHNIPIVVLQGTGGWSEKLANTYLDSRNRVRIIGARTAEEAVQKALALTKTSSTTQESQ